MGNLNNFESGYKDSRDGFELEYFLKRGIVDLKSISAYKAGWWAYKSGAVISENFDHVEIGLEWD
jgi:hypothetical protein